MSARNSKLAIDFTKNRVPLCSGIGPSLIRSTAFAWDAYLVEAQAEQPQERVKWPEGAAQCCRQPFFVQCFYVLAELQSTAVNLPPSGLA